jgi:hypothetical protein
MRHWTAAAVSNEGSAGTLNGPPPRRGFDPAVFCAGITIVFAVIGLAGTYAATAYLGRGGFYETILFTPGDSFGPMAEGPLTSFGIHHFGDLLLPWLQTIDGNPYLTTALFRSNYPPFAHLFLEPFTTLPYKAVFWIYLLSSCLLLALPLWASLRGRRLDVRLTVVSAVVGLSFPLWVTLDRGNIQSIVVGFALLAMLAVQRGRWMTAALLLAVPGALKIYPAVLLLIFIRERKWKEFLISVMAIGVLSISGLLSMAASPPENIRALWFQTSAFRNAVVDPSVVNQYNISPLAFFQWMHLRSDIFGDRLGGALEFHFRTVVLIAVLGCVILLMSRLLTRFEATVLMVLPTLFALELVGAYALLLLLVPLIFLFSSGRDVTRFEIVTAVLVVALMAPKKIPFDSTGATLATVGYPVIEALIFAVVLMAYLCRRFPAVAERIEARLDNFRRSPIS